LNVEELVKYLQEEREKYYSGEADISDVEFDKLENTLKQYDPDNSYFEQVGAPVVGPGKVLHKHKMLSLQKSTNEQDIFSWLKKFFPNHQINILTEPKIDGVSLTNKYNKGKLYQVATRGNGEIGRDVSHLANYVEDIPKTIPFDGNIEIRGEVYLPKNTPLPAGKSLRNQAAGLVNRKGNQEDLRHLRFIAYDLIGFPTNSEKEKLDTLKQLAPNVISYEEIGSLEELRKIYNDYSIKKREELPYLIDGMVIKINLTLDQNKFPRETTHHPNWAMAYKFKAEEKQTRLIRVDWTQGQTGKITPIAIFEPVELSGATIQKASLGSKRKFELLRLEPGDIISVSRQHEVIPYVMSNITKGIKNE
jgi:DNA ligase (NAD+)